MGSSDSSLELETPEAAVNTSVAVKAPQEPSALQPFPIESRSLVHQTPLFGVEESQVRHPTTGKLRTFVALKNADWVNVVTELSDGNLLMVRQWRHGSQQMELEFPAGLVDPGEDALDAGRREVLEETGHSSESLEVIGWVKPNTAYQQNRCTTLWARNCRPISTQKLDAFEEVEVVKLSPAELQDLINVGEIRSAMTICAFFWWKNAKF